MSTCLVNTAKYAVQIPAAIFQGFPFIYTHFVLPSQTSGLSTLAGHRSPCTVAHHQSGNSVSLSARPGWVCVGGVCVSHASVHWVHVTSYRCVLSSSHLLAWQGKALPTKPVAVHQLQVSTPPAVLSPRLGRRRRGPNVQNSHRLQEATTGPEYLHGGHFHCRCFKAAWVIWSLQGTDTFPHNLYD